MKSMLRIPPATAATPLISLTALAFDTETTSLDVETGRIIEIGAVAMVDGAISNDTAFVSFVKPHVDIPAASTKIHGITSNDLGQAPEFAEAWKSFRIFAAGHILLGYSIDFDLMLLVMEHARAGLAWKPPTALDVRGLVRLLRATLPDYALETVAEWLGVGVIGRHRAQPDALLTAQVFLGLLPRLREQGIRTLGEALAASRKLEERQGRPSLITATSGRLTVSPIARTDSFPYRHRVADIMARPPVMISAEATIADAMDLMVAEKVSSAFVQGSPLGILTERDVLRAFAAGRQKAFNA
jgi:DNA polymerase-3 subunit epsilon/CBS domain-containing protein